MLISHAILAEKEQNGPVLYGANDAVVRAK